MSEFEKGKDVGKEKGFYLGIFYAFTLFSRNCLDRTNKNNCVNTHATCRYEACPTAIAAINKFKRGE